jgi:DNA-binding CsgD family transcriptional regulator/tetratricopeptide (TPR) repeat protein
VGLHARLAQALQDDPGLAVGAHGAAAQRAMHWSAAHELAAALSASVQAGTEAERVWSFAEANSHFEHAVELWAGVPTEQRPADQSLVELLGRAAEAAYLSGQIQRAVTLTRSALELLDPDSQPVVVGLARARLGRYLLGDAELLEALAEYRAAAALLPVAPSAALASILAGEAHILMLQGEGLQARAPCEEAIRIAHEVGAAEVECDALNTLGAVLVQLGAVDEGLEALRKGHQLAMELGALEELRRAYINLGQALDDAGRVDEAAELAREGWERLRSRIGTAAAFLAAEAGLRLIRLGNWDLAQGVLEEAAEMARPGRFAGMVAGALGWIEALRGELERASAHVRSAAQLLPKDVFWVSLEAPAAELALARGHPEEVRELVDIDGGMPHVYPTFFTPLLVLAVRAEAELAQRARSDREPTAEREAITRAEALLSCARALTAPENWPLGSAPSETLLEAELCELEMLRARKDDRADAWATLAARWVELGRPFAAAYARLREADAALVENLPRARITEPLASARATATSLGARPLLEQIELVSRRARVRAADDEVPGEVAGLTPRELDVLRLVAEGRTNPEIGTALYMSPKTASVHVSRILSKLDVRTRTEAAGVAHRLGLLEDPGRERDVTDGHG